MDSISEKTSVKLPLVYVIPIAISLITFGGVVDRVLGQENKIDAVNKSSREYTEQEVSGLRADWERDMREQNRRLELLEKEHLQKK